MGLARRAASRIQGEGIRMSDRKKSAGDEEAARGNLRRLFGRLAFEKGNAYGRRDEEDAIARMKEDAVASRRRARSKKADGEEKPPEAYPGP